LAVWRAKPAKFAAMNDWLFAGDQTRSVEAARAKAAQLIGKPTLARTMREDVDWRRDFLNAQGRLNHTLGKRALPERPGSANKLPKLVLPNYLLLGRPRNAASVFEQLEKHLPLKSDTPTPPR
jgi:hypothetical protein